jgi:ferredoxin
MGFLNWDFKFQVKSEIQNLKSYIKMAIIITDECINCGACEPECPNTAIYEGADDWRYKDGTKLKGKVILPDGSEVDSEAAQTPISDDIYYIVPGKCTECKGFHDEPQCAAVCPVDCCIPDDNHVESEETLLNRQAFLHNE